MKEILLASHDEDPKFEHIKFTQPIKKSVLTILGKEGNMLIPAGTGFTITPDGLMMTAKHVIEEIFPNPHKYDLTQLSLQYPGRELFALIIESEQLGGLWPIDRVWADDDGIDIALMF